MKNENKLKDSEIKYLIENMVIIVDTREKENKHIINYFNSNKIKHIDNSLNYGDYAFYIKSNKIFKRDLFIKNIAIERKNSLNEISINLTQKRNQFLDELERAEKNKSKLIIAIENKVVALKCKKCTKIYTVLDINKKCECGNTIAKNDLFIYLFEDGFDKIKRSDYRSKFNKNAFESSLYSISNDFKQNNYVTFVNYESYGEFIYKTFKYHLRSRLKYYIKT